MTKRRRQPALDPRSDALFASKRPARVPHEFVLEALGAAAPTTRAMFGCLAVYVADKIVLVLRDKARSPEDNGVWLATTKEHHASLRRDFPHMRSIRVFGHEVTGWQVLPVDAPDFEEAALKSGELILAGDPRIGKLAKPRSPSRPRARNAIEPSGRRKRSPTSRT